MFQPKLNKPGCPYCWSISVPFLLCELGVGQVAAVLFSTSLCWVLNLPTCLPWIMTSFLWAMFYFPHSFIHACVTFLRPFLWFFLILLCFQCDIPPVVVFILARCVDLSGWTMACLHRFGGQTRATKYFPPIGERILLWCGLASFHHCLRSLI